MKRNVDCNDNTKKINTKLHLRVWQSDRCAMWFFPSVQNKIITAIIYGQFSFSALLCSVLVYSISFSRVFFCFAKQKDCLELNEFARYLEHVIIQVTAVHFHICVCGIFFISVLVYEIGGTWLFRLLSSHRSMLWISFFTTLDSSSSSSDSTMCPFICVCVHYTDKDQSVQCDKLERIWESLVAYLF